MIDIKKSYFVISIALIIGFSLSPTWAEEVVVYTALDQVYSEPLLKRFEERTGIEVKPVYDTEAVKTVGLVNRIIAEREKPRCDVFWNNEIIRTIMLKQKGLLAPYHSPSATDIPVQFKDPEGYWTGFAARLRILAYNRDLIEPEDVPGGMMSLGSVKNRQDLGLAYPAFGTTATHFAALYTAWGEDRSRLFFQHIKNNLRIVDGNATCCRMTANGILKAGFTDTDDANALMEDGKPISILIPDQNDLGALLIPNSVGLIQNCPNPENGKKLIDFLLSPEVEEYLAASRSAQIPLRAYVPRPDKVVDISKIKLMPVDYERVATNLEQSTLLVNSIFNR